MLIYMSVKRKWFYHLAVWKLWGRCGILNLVGLNYGFSCTVGIFFVLAPHSVFFFVGSMTFFGLSSLQSDYVTSACESLLMSAAQ